MRSYLQLSFFFCFFHSFFLCRAPISCFIYYNVCSLCSKNVKKSLQVFLFFFLTYFTIHTKYL